MVNYTGMDASQLAGHLETAAISSDILRSELEFLQQDKAICEHYLKILRQQVAESDDRLRHELRSSQASVFEMYLISPTFLNILIIYTWKFDRSATHVAAKFKTRLHYTSASELYKLITNIVL